MCVCACACVCVCARGCVGVWVIFSVSVSVTLAGLITYMEDTGVWEHVFLPLMIHKQF